MYICAVASGKGGVGKTTTCLGVGLALVAQGKKVAILDLDLENPSLGTVCDFSRSDLRFNGNYIIPPEWNGIKIMSLSLLPLFDFKDTPTMANEERKHELIIQMFNEVSWDDTEILLVDMCPGSGEEVRGLLQINPTSMLVITTPQSISEAAVRRVIHMAYEYAIPILGIVENNLNQSRGAAGPRLAEAYNLPLLTRLTWSRKIVQQMETHQPLPHDRFKVIANKIIEETKNGDSLRVGAQEILRNGSSSSEQEGAGPEHSSEDPGGFTEDSSSESVEAATGDSEGHAGGVDTTL